MILIKTSPIPNQTFQFTLDNQYCTFLLRQKGRRLYLDLSLADVEVCTGAICTNRTSLVQSPKEVFSGTLFFYDTLGDEAPQYDGLNTRFYLLYFSADEDIPSELLV